MAMSRQSDLIEVIEQIAERDGRYRIGGYLLVLEGLDYASRKRGRVGHVSGKELLDAIRELVLDRYGPMAITVLMYFGVGCTEDFGNIVFNMVDGGVLGKTEKDTKEDFVNVYDFRDVFE
jgi:uncharacterized repeat protein (TIGR04138 family)